MARRHLKFTLKQNFRIWFQKFAALDDQRTIKKQSVVFNRRIFFRRFFRKWRKEFKQVQLKLLLAKKLKYFQNDVTKRKFLTRWRISFITRRSLATKGYFVHHGKQKDLLTRAWYALRKYKDVRKRANLINQAMDQQYRAKILKKCIVAWNSKLPTIKMKRQLQCELFKDYSLRLKAKVLKVFFLNYKYCQRRKETDEAMTKAVKEIGMRKFFRYWRSMANKRIGLLLFEQTFEKLKVASFFRRASRKILFEGETRAHMNLLRDYQNLAKTFGALRIYRQRRDMVKMKLFSFQSIQNMLISERFFKEWRHQFAKQITEKRITNYAVSHIEGSLVKRCFDAIKSNFVTGMKNRIVRIKHMNTIRRQAFDALRKNSYIQKITCEMILNRDKATKQSFLNFWMLEMREKRMIKGLVVNHMYSLAAKAIHALRHNARIKHHKQYLLQKGQALNNFNLMKRVFCSFSTNASNQNHHRYAIQTIQQLQKVNTRRHTLKALYQTMINTKIHSLIFEQVSLRSNRRIASNALAQMRQLTRHRTLMYKACRMLHKKQQEISVKISFQNWTTFMQFTKQVEVITQQFDVYKRTQSLRKVFKCLKVTTKQKRAKRCLLDALLEKSILIRKQRLLQSLKQILKRQQTNRLNKHVAVTYREDRLRRLTLSILHVHNLNQRRIRFIFGTTIFQRLVPKAFAGLQMNRNVQKVKRGMCYKASYMHSFQLQRKALAALAQYVARRRLLNSMSKTARTFARQALLKRVLLKLQKGTKSARLHQNKRNLLFNVVFNWSNQVTQKKMFNFFVQGIKCIKQEQTATAAKMLKSKKSRCFQAWHGFQLYNKGLVANVQTVQGNRGFFKMKNCFARWLTAFSYEMKIKLHHRHQQTKLLQKGFNSFRLAKNLQKATLYAGMWHQEYLKRAFFNAIFAQRSSKEVKIEKATQIENLNDIRLKTRVILAFKYFLICQNSHKIIRKKLDRTILEKAFGALKYQTVSQRIVHDYVRFQNAKSRKKMFMKWRHRFEEINLQKAKLLPIITKLDRKTKDQSFKEWRKSAFRERFMLLLHDNLLVPQQIDMARRYLRGWRKYTKFSKTKNFNLNEMRILRKFNTRRRIFEFWFNSAMQRAPFSIFASKMQNLRRKFALRRSFALILEAACKDQQLEGRVKMFKKQTMQKQKAMFVSLLKKKAKSARQANLVIQRRQINLISGFFQRWLISFDRSIEAREQYQIENFALEQAGQFYDLKLKKSCYTKLFSNVFAARKDQQAAIYYLENFKRRVFEKMVMYSEVQKSQGSPNRLVLQFKQRQARTLLKECMVMWQHQVSQKGQARQIIKCFQKYCSIRLLGQTFSGMRHWSHNRKSRRQKDIQAAELIARKQRLRIKVEVFAHLISLSRKQHENKLKQSALADQLEQSYEQKLSSQTFDAWNSVTAKESESQRRSRMYSVFSAWKFYAKERSLLKRYLFDCGESIDDLSQMTTMRLREVTEQRKIGVQKLNITDLSTNSLQGGVNSRKSNDRYRQYQMMNSQSQAESSQYEASKGANINLPTSVGLVLSKFSQRSQRSTGPAVIPTPSFLRESLPEVNVRASRHISPDTILEGAAQRKQVEVKSAEQYGQRKRSTTVVSLLQKQFGQ